MAHHDPQWRGMIYLILVSQGHEVVMASSGDEAYGKAFEIGIATIITSRFLEGRTESELAQDVWNAGIEVPFILVDSKLINGDKWFFKSQVEPDPADLLVARLLGAIDNL